MKRMILIVLILAMVNLTGCDKEVAGCMDGNSGNYNPDATMEDGSCRYPADHWAGTYEVRDSAILTRTSDGDSRTIVSVKEMIVERIADNRVRIDSLLGMSMTGKVLPELFTPDEQPDRDFTAVQCRRSGDTIRYSYFMDHGFATYEIRGTAIKQ